MSGRTTLCTWSSTSSEYRNYGAVSALWLSHAASWNARRCRWISEVRRWLREHGVHPATVPTTSVPMLGRSSSIVRAGMCRERIGGTRRSPTWYATTGLDRPTRQRVGGSQRAKPPASPSCRWLGGRPNRCRCNPSQLRGAGQPACPHRKEPDRGHRRRHRRPARRRTRLLDPHPLSPRPPICSVPEGSDLADMLALNGPATLTTPWVGRGRSARNSSMKGSQTCHPIRPSSRRRGSSPPAPGMLGAAQPSGGHSDRLPHREDGGQW